MTREEAITILKCERPYGNSGCGATDEEIEEALSMAIKALKQEPCDDCIRRSDIGLTDFEIVMCDGNYKQALEMLLDKIEKAPPVIPQPKTGHWIWAAYDYDSPELGYWECSECNKVVLIPSFKTFNMYERFHYCPNCGAKMQEVEE